MLSSFLQAFSLTPAVVAISPISRGARYLLAAMVLFSITLGICAPSAHAGEVSEAVLEKYASGINESFGEDVANAFRGYARYFASIVEDGREAYIVEILNAVFKNPGKKSVFDLFLSKLEKRLKSGQKIDKNIIAEMSSFIEPIGIELAKKIDIQNKRLALPSAESATLAAESATLDAESARLDAESARLDAESARLDAESATLDAESARLDAESATLDAESARLDAESATLDAEIAKVKEEIKKVKSQIVIIRDASKQIEKKFN